MLPVFDDVASVEREAETVEDSTAVGDEDIERVCMTVLETVGDAEAVREQARVVVLSIAIRAMPLPPLQGDAVHGKLGAPTAPYAEVAAVTALE